MNKQVIIDGDNFSSEELFYVEIQNKLTKDLQWNIGRNLNAFNDVLNGGFGVTEYEEPFKLIWLNSNKSKAELISKYQNSTFFDDVIKIIKSHDHIYLELR